MVTSKELLFRRTISRLDQTERRFLQKALRFAKLHHNGQMRITGEPFIVHPLSVALNLFLKYKDIPLTAAALLHDVVEDCNTVSIQDIYENLGKEVGFLVDAVTKGKNGFSRINEIEFEDKLERILWAGTRDIRVILLKLADREHNLRTLGSLASEYQIRMAFETQAVYQPLKDILEYHTSLCIEKAQMLLGRFILINKIKTPREFKEILCKVSFENMDRDMFGLVYEDSGSIIWNIDNISLYEKLCSNIKIAESIKFENIRTGNDWFKASFKFRNGVLLDKDTKLSVLSFKSVI